MSSLAALGMSSLAGADFLSRARGEVDRGMRLRAFHDCARDRQVGIAGPSARIIVADHAQPPEGSRHLLARSDDNA